MDREFYSKDVIRLMKKYSVKQQDILQRLEKSYTYFSNRLHLKKDKNGDSFLFTFKEYETIKSIINGIKCGAETIKYFKDLHEENNKLHETIVKETYKRIGLSSVEIENLLTVWK
jgi:hypothetical protein